MTPFATHPVRAYLQALAERHIAMSVRDGALCFSPEPPPDVAEALRPYAGEITAALAPYGGPTLWFPLTPGQEALWYLQRINPASIEYNTVAAFTVPLPLDLPALQHAFDEIARYVPVIRSFYAEVAGQPAQVFLQDHAVHVDHYDCSGLTQAELEARLSADYNRPYDLGRTGLFTITAYTTGPASHAVMIAAHHIVGDFWSLTLLIQHVMRVYAAARQGEWIALPEPPFPYPEHVLAHRELLTGPRGEELRAYWQAQLRDARSGLDLPGDRPRPASRTGRGEMRHFTLDAALTSDVLRAARALGTTPYTLLLTAFQAFLMRLTGQTDLLTGTPMHGRRDKRTRQSIGYFSNMTALRNQFAEGETFAAAVARMHTTVNGAVKHHDYPFPLVAELVPGPRDPSRPALIETGFTYFQAGDAASAIAAFPMDRGGVTMEIAGLPLSSLAVRPQGAMLDLSLLAAQLDDTIACVWQYTTDLFDAATIVRLTARWETLLRALVTDPEQPITLGAWLPPHEQAELARWNATETPFDLTRDLTALITGQTRRNPDAPAARDPQHCLAYRDIDEQSLRVARRLREAGIGRGSVVGAHLGRGVEILPVLLGIMRAGAAYLPLDPAFPAARLSYMARDSGAALIIADAATSLPDLPEGCSVMPLAAALAPDAALAACLPPAPQPEDPAYLLYTSGSTGQPKGVVIPHRALSNFLQAMQARLALGPADRLLAVTSISFDIAGLELFLPLTVGATVEIVPAEIVSDGFQLARVMEEQRPTIMQATPATWQMLLDAGWRGDARLTLLCGGEALSRDLADALLLRCATLWNMYGPTETTIWSAMARVTPGTEAPPIGLPIANTTFHVSDAQGDPLPVGISGELVIGGAGLALGYFRRPELTARRFTELAGARVYRTGDLVRRNADGSLRFLGRADGQVKLHGHRIELGEIEHSLSEHPAVSQAVVKLFDPDQPHRLVAYVIPRDADAAFDPAAFADYLRHRLPAYMIPSAFARCDAFPLTSNRKVDRAALPAPSVRAVATTAPLTPEEERVAAIWRDVLHQPAAHAGSDFFASGGHSLLLVTLIARAQQAFGVTIALADFLRAPTLGNLARLACQHQESGAAPTPAADARLTWEHLAPREPRPPAPPRVILLTGASGFLGVHLLAEILRTSMARIICLARGGMASITRQLRAYRLDADLPAVAERVSVMPGDLALPNCDLSVADQAIIRDEVDAILHCGATVNFVYPYPALRGANVLSAHALLGLALSGASVRAFHYVSTFSVFDDPTYAGRAIAETEIPARGGDILHAYGQSKWAAETLTRHAGERGLSTAIYRPGRVSGHSVTGWANPADLLDLVVRGCLDLGAYPKASFMVDMTPVDYVARAIATGVLTGQGAGNYHLVNPQPLSVDDLVKALRRAGYRLSGISYNAWRKRIQTRHHPSLEPLLPLFSDDLLALLADAPIFATDRAATLHPIPCPPPDAALLGRYIAYNQATGAWPEPPPRRERRRKKEAHAK